MSNVNRDTIKWIYFLPITILILFGVHWLWKWSLDLTVLLTFICIGYADGQGLNIALNEADLFVNNDNYKLFLALTSAPIIIYLYFLLGNFFGPENKFKNRLMLYLVIVNYALSIPIAIYSQNAMVCIVSIISLFCVYLFKDDSSKLYLIISKLRSSVIFRKISLVALIIAQIYIVVTTWYFVYYIYLFSRNHSFLTTLFLAPFVCTYKAIFWPFLM